MIDGMGVWARSEKLYVTRGLEQVTLEDTGSKFGTHLNAAMLSDSQVINPLHVCQCD